MELWKVVWDTAVKPLPSCSKDKMCLKGNVVRSSWVLGGGLHAGGICGPKSDGAVQVKTAWMEIGGSSSLG